MPHIRSVTVRAVLPHPPTVTALGAVFSPDGSRLAVGGSDGAVRGYPAATAFRPGPPLPPLRAACTAVAFRPEGGAARGGAAGEAEHRGPRNMLLAAGGDGSLTSWHLGSGRAVRTLWEKDNVVNVVQYRKDGRMFASAGNDATVRVYDEDRGTIVTEMREGAMGSGAAFAHSSRITALRYVSDTMIVTGGWDYTVHIWDTRQGRSQCFLYGPYLCANGLDVSESRLVTASCRTNDQVELWDIRNMEKMRSYNIEGTSENPRAYAAKFDSDGKYVSVAGNGFLEIYGLSMGVLIEVPIAGTPAWNTNFYDVTWSPDGTKLCAVGKDVYLLEVAHKEMTLRAEAARP